MHTPVRRDNLLDAVICRAEDAAATTWDDDVRGTLRFRTLFDSADPTGTLNAGMAELAPGGWMGMHRHPPPEIYHVVEGRGLLTVNGTRHHVEPGCSVFIPGNAPHGISCVGGSLLRFLYFFPTNSSEDIEYEWLGRPPVVRDGEAESQCAVGHSVRASAPYRGG